jgi:hypothetical protein
MEVTDGRGGMDAKSATESSNMGIENGNVNRFGNNWLTFGSNVNLRTLIQLQCETQVAIPALPPNRAQRTTALDLAEQLSDLGS